MSSSNPKSTSATLGLALAYLRPALPAITTLLNLLAIGGGLYDFADSHASARAFGIVLPSSPSAIETAWARVHGIRNVGTGLGGLAMLTYLQFSHLTKTSPTAAVAVRRVIGLTLICGTVVALGDAWILQQLAETKGVSGDVVELAVKQSRGHSFMALPIALLGVVWVLL